MKTIAYVSNSDDGSVHVLQLHPQGQLTPVQRIELGGMLMPMALAADRRALYVARRSAPLAVVALSIDPHTGQLATLGEVPLPASMAYLDVDRGGRWLLAASYPGHMVSVHAIGDDRLPRRAHQVVAAVPHAHCVRRSADGSAAFVASLGADEIRQYRFDDGRGRLEPQARPAVALPAGSGPRHIEFHPSLPVVYVLDELDGQMHVFDIAGHSLWHRQRVAACPPDAPLPIWGADVRATPDGRFVYASERTGSTITGLRVDAASGELSTIGHWPTQRQPRAIAIARDGRFLLSAGQLSHRIGVHAIGADGALTPVSELAVGRQPSWIELLAMP